jgi:hypothetical protein
LPLYRLVERYYEQVKGLWEKRFERRYGYWRGFLGAVVYALLDCGALHRGFAQVYCDTCKYDLLMSWQANTGLPVHNTVSVEPEDPAAVERLARYLLRPPLSVERLTFDEQASEVRYRRKRPSPLDELIETLDPLELLARILVHVAPGR